MVRRPESSSARGRKALDRLWERDSGICHLCGDPISERRFATRDHVVPWAEGGRGWRNLALAHRACNHKRGSMPVEAAREYIRARRNFSQLRARGVSLPRPEPEDYL